MSRERMPQNVEKSAFRRGKYVGYGNGVWLITRSNAYYGKRLPAKWQARHRDKPDAPYIYGRSLAEIGEKIAATAEKLSKNPRRKCRVAKRRLLAAGVVRGKHRKRHVVRRRKVETVKRNPVSKRYIIEALTLNGSTPRYFYWSDAHQLFTDKRPQASAYASEKTARIEAKKLNVSPRLPTQICCLRVVPE